MTRSESAAAAAGPSSAGLAVLIINHARGARRGQAGRRSRGSRVLVRAHIACCEYNTVARHCALAAEQSVWSVHNGSFGCSIPRAAERAHDRDVITHRNLA